MIIILILIFLAAFFKSIADTLVHHRSSSIFSLWSKWWSSDWNEKYQVRGPLRYLYTHISDAWHFSNSSMITCFLVAIILCLLNDFKLICSFWITFCIFFGVWFISFELFYKLWVVLKPKNKK